MLLDSKSHCWFIVLINLVPTMTKILGNEIVYLIVVVVARPLVDETSIEFSMFGDICLA